MTPEAATIGPDGVEAEPGAPSRLRFPVTAQPGTGDGSVVTIRDGVDWLRMPVGGALGSINVWRLRDGDGFAVVDTGMRNAETAAAWRIALADAPVSRVIVTHLHADHSGMAGWLVRRHGASLWMSKLEYYTLRSLVSDSGHEPPEAAMRFYHAAGWSDEALDMYRGRFGQLGRSVYPLPSSFVALCDRDHLTIDGHDWEVVIGRGHSPEHALLYCAALKLVIAGDQILPTISPNVSVQPQEPLSDPLTDWLAALVAIKDRIPDDVLVLPSHGQPFEGLHDRIDELVERHENGLRRVMAMLDTPRRVIDVFPALFRRAIGPRVLGLATGESMAHLACLRTRRIAMCETGADGVDLWRLC